ncbi:MAG: VOC family protein [Myxococcales bacterium]|nr:VOC family protein [Myxococcales bacterium]
MSRSRIVPCLWFDSQAEQAVAFYQQVFPESGVIATSRYAGASDNPDGEPRGKVLTVEFELGSLRFTALNGGPHFTMNPSISFFVHVDSVDEADRLFAALAQDGDVMMPLGSYPWSERYGWVKDRFGASWQVIAGRRPPGGATVVPCLMFVGAQHGRAEEAMLAYAGIFPNSRQDSVARYTADEGPAGTVKHGRFLLDGQDMIAADSHFDHGFSFSEGISLQVTCEDQAEVDHYWAALGQGGAHGQCGWLKDRFGLSWQVVPAALSRLLSGTDQAAVARAFAAMMSMTKLDIAELERAFRGA